ncbi:LAFE_0B01596g1_1 [Lachancea fermentati]|uniref:Kinesin-like protein KIP1 n=1 Tax=Lachancea fermentati TaxID=4955 RepID=A0A1G4M7D5_LACFM|nr:LAFE_0B01596g1_1 [Lachancea fermentati]
MISGTVQLPSEVGHNGLNSASLENSSMKAAASEKVARSPQFRNRRDEHAHNIKVYVRCRSRNQREIDEKSSVVISTASRGAGRELMLNGSNGKKAYSFDRVFGAESDQEAVFEETAKTYIGEMLRGYNCTVFAYGQTGTGKTYTMSGDIKSISPIDTSQQSILLSEHAGIIPRILVELFKQLPQESKDFSVKVSFLELYNEKLRDLLACSIRGSDEEKHTDRFAATETIRIYDNNHNNAKSNESSITVRGMQELYIKSAHEGLELLREGSLKRQVAATKCNDLSSRSHTVFTITTNTTKTDPLSGKEFVKVGKLNLVDLAGSENITRSGVGAESMRAQEAGLINKSLLTLGRVINALVDHSQHIPYRESKLTRLLQDSLGGKTKTCIIATISPAKICMEETISTLEYATRAKSIKNTPQINQSMAKDSCITEYIREIDKLRQELRATRDKEGIYVTQEQYDLYESNCILVGEQKVRMDILEEQIKGFKEKYVEQLQISRKADHKVKALEQNFKVLKDEKLSVESSLKTLQAQCRWFEVRINEIHVNNIQNLDLLREENKNLDRMLNAKIEYITNVNEIRENEVNSLNSIRSSLQTSHQNFQDSLVLAFEELQNHSSKLKNETDLHFKSHSETKDLLAIFDSLEESIKKKFEELRPQMDKVKNTALSCSREDIDDNIHALETHYRNLERTLSLAFEKFKKYMFQEFEQAQCKTKAQHKQLLELIDKERIKVKKLQEENQKLIRSRNDKDELSIQLSTLFGDKIMKTRQAIFENVLDAVRQAELEHKDLDTMILSESSRLLTDFEKRKKRESQAGLAKCTESSLNAFEELRVSVTQNGEKCERALNEMTSLINKECSTLQLDRTLSSAANFITNEFKDRESDKANFRIQQVIEEIGNLQSNLAEYYKETLSGASNNVNSVAKKLEDKINLVYSQVQCMDEYVSKEQRTCINRLKDEYRSALFEKLSGISDIALKLTQKYDEQTSNDETSKQAQHFSEIIRELPQLLRGALTEVYKDDLLRASRCNQFDGTEIQYDTTDLSTTHSSTKVLNPKEINLVLQGTQVSDCSSDVLSKPKRRLSSFIPHGEENQESYQTELSTKKTHL